MPELFAATLTPFTSPTGGIDLEWIPRHLRWLEAQGVDGVAPCGTTGEGPSLSADERRSIIDTVLANRGKLRVIPGTGCSALPDTIELTHYALERGADAALVLPAFYFKNLSDAGLLAFYRAVCDGLPPGGKIMLYHIPPISHIPITTGVLDGLLESHPDAIYGLKDSGNDADHTAMLIERYPQLQIFTGSGPLLQRALDDGAAGGIFAIANAFPRELRSIIDAHAEGRRDEAAQNRATEITAAFREYGNVAALKAMLPRITDLPATFVRAPLRDMTGDEAAALASSLGIA